MPDSKGRKVQTVINGAKTVAVASVKLAIYLFAIVGVVACAYGWFQSSSVYPAIIRAQYIQELEAQYVAQYQAEQLKAQQNESIK